VLYGLAVLGIVLLGAYVNYIGKVLQTYSLDDILELNELTEEDILFFLVEEVFLKSSKSQQVVIKHD